MIDIAYVLPELSISGGIGIVFRHVLELNKLGRQSVIFMLRINLMVNGLTMIILLNVMI